MGNYHVAFKTLIRESGGEPLVAPPISKRTLELGTRHSPEFVCLPFKINLGNYMEAIEQGAEVVLQAGRAGACRYGFYGEVQELILRDLGWDVPVVKLFKGGKQVNFIAGLKEMNPRAGTIQILKAARLTVMKIHTIDWMEQQARRLRAMELVPGEADRALGQGVELLDRASSVYRVYLARQRITEMFAGIDRDDSRKPVRIGIVGELYVVMEPFANLNLEEKLGRMGVEVKRPLCLSEMLHHVVLPHQRRAITRSGRPFITYELGAHAGHSVGHAMEFAREGLDGVIQLYPFTCMPELSARAVLAHVSRSMGIPVLHFSLGEQTGEAAVDTRLEAFVEMLSRKKAGLKH